MTSYCVFNVGERRVAIDLAHVREIIEHHLVVPTPIPLTPRFVHGLFNLRGQVLPYIDLSPFVGAQSAPAAPGRDHRAVIVERGPLRFAATGHRIDTVEADPSTFAPLANAALLPALEAEADTDYGRFHVIHLDRLEACLSQSLKLLETPARSTRAPAATLNETTTNAPTANDTATSASPNATAITPSASASAAAPQNPDTKP